MLKANHLSFSSNGKIARVRDSDLYPQDGVRKSSSAVRVHTHTTTVRKMLEFLDLILKRLLFFHSGEQKNRKWPFFTMLCWLEQSVDGLKVNRGEAQAVENVGEVIPVEAVVLVALFR